MVSKTDVALVTGAGGGIGSAVAARLADAGYVVVANDQGVSVDGQRPTQGVADEVVDKIRASGGVASADYGSVADFTSVGELITGIIAKYGRLDLLVTCHGILRERMIFNMSEDEWDDVVDVHLKGTFNCVRFASAQMRAQRNGSIVLLTSSAGLEGSPAQANYAAAKLGIVGLGFSSALAMGQYGVNVNCIAPVAATRMTARLTEATAANRPAGERAGPALIAELVLALSRPGTRHITGQVYTATGDRIARWSNPRETASVMVGSSYSEEDVLNAVVNTLGTESLRRFTALGLPEPLEASQGVGHA